MTETAADPYASSLGHEPAMTWAFDESVANCFDDMLERSIPEYEAMRRQVFRVGSAFVQPHTDVVDLGCSHGEGIQPFLDRFGAQQRWLLLDSSLPMLNRARDRYRGWMDARCMRVEEHDLRQPLPAFRASLVLCVLTLQFVPVEFRLRILADVLGKLAEGGALILVEKVIGSGSVLDEVFRAAHHRLKVGNGYSAAEVEAKRKSLEHAMVPLAAEWNQNMLVASGFGAVEPFWRCLNFCGWVAVR